MNDVQKVSLNIYKEVKKICDKYNITYFAVGGTCIGVVRHKGFIPWDDDIDIAIPIEEIDLFLRVMEKELPEYLNVRTGYKYSKMETLFIKIEDIRTTFIEKIEVDDVERYKGVFMDVMPMAGLPSKKKDRSRLVRRLKILFLLNSSQRCRFKECLSLKRKVFWLIARPFCYGFRYDFFMEKYWEILKEYPLIENEFVGYTWSGALKRLIFKKEYFKDVVEFPFEDTYMNCPIGWDNYLSEQFGNYMELPKPEMRKSGHQGIVDVQTSYKEYQLHPEKLDKYKKEKGRKNSSMR